MQQKRKQHTHGNNDGGEQWPQRHINRPALAVLLQVVRFDALAEQLAIGDDACLLSV